MATKHRGAAKVQWWPLRRLKASESNPRTHSAAQVEAIASSIAAFGFNAPVLVQPDGTVVAGHGRMEAAIRLKLEAVPVVVLEHLTPAQARAYLIADNRIGDLATWDFGLLAQEVQNLKALGQPEEVHLDAIGYTERELAKMLAEEGGGGDSAGSGDGSGRGSHVYTDGPFDPPTHPASAEGDVWQLGVHRVIVADSTKPEVVPVVLADLPEGEGAACCITDPPYAIYGSASGIASDITDDKMVRPFFRAVVDRLVDVVRPFGHAYVFCDWRSWASWWEVAKGTGFAIKNMVVWDKNGAGLGSNYANTHELVAFASVLPLRRGMSQKLTGIKPVHDSNVWEFPRVPTGEERVHNAQKPVELLRRAIRNSTEPGELVVDLFAGSGSTLIACELEGRACRTVDVDPRYADATILRWQHVTGLEAVHLASGHTYAQRRAALGLEPAFAGV